MKKQAVLLAFLLMTQFTKAQFNLIWQNSQNLHKAIKNVAVDNQGSTIVTGTFGATLSFGNSVLTNNVSNSTASFITKTDSAGGWLWANGPGGAARKIAPNSSGSSVWINDVTTDNGGNIYVTGCFKGSISVGTTTLSQSGNNNGTADIFTAKLNSSGTFLWAKKEGSNRADAANGLAVDGAGNVYVAGSYSRAAGNGNNAIVLSDLYIVKYSSSGQKSWEKKYAVNNINGNGAAGNDIALDASGNPYVTGSFKGTISFATNLSLTSARHCTYLLKFSPGNGAAIWARKATSNGDNIAWSMLVDGTNNIYLAGSYWTNSIAFASLSLPAPANYDYGWISGDDNAFVVKYSPAGDPVWLTQTMTEGMGNTSTVKVFRHPDQKVGLFTEGANGIHLKSFDAADGLEISDVLSVGFNWQAYADGLSFATAGDVAPTATGYVYTVNGSGSFSFGNLILTSALPFYETAPIDMFVARYTAEQQQVQQRLAKNEKENYLGEKELLVYPNPVMHNLYIQTNTNDPIGRIYLLDQSGRTVLDQYSPETKITIDIQHLAAGTYYLRAEHQKQAVKLTKN